ncbi:MAG TPA: ABC transporter permease, partial [Gemmatimonadaceae bacterium]
MRPFKHLALRVRALFGTTAAERDLDDEIRFHLEQEANMNARAGVDPDEARLRARRAFGNVEVAKEAHRDTFGVRWLRDFATDVRFALRTLRRAPVLGGAAIVTFALGIGANTAIFSAVNAVILRPLTFDQPDHLVMLWETNPDYHWTDADAAPANMLDWRDRVGAFADVAAYNDFNTPVTLTGIGRPQLLSAAYVTGNFFSVLGVNAELGRTLRDEETWTNGTHVAVISDRLWRNTFNGDASVIGRTVTLDGTGIQIVGVAPPTFAYPYDNGDVWLPVEWKPADRAQVYFRRAHWLRPIARLKPGVSLQSADAQLQTVVKQLQSEFALTNRVMGAGMTPLHDWMVRDTRLPLLILLAAVALLLLIACANVG